MFITCTSTWHSYEYRAYSHLEADYLLRSPWASGVHTAHRRGYIGSAYLPSALNALTKNSTHVFWDKLLATLTVWDTVWSSRAGANGNTILQVFFFETIQKSVRLKMFSHRRNGKNVGKMIVL